MQGKQETERQGDRVTLLPSGRHFDEAVRLACLPERHDARILVITSVDHAIEQWPYMFLEYASRSAPTALVHDVEDELGLLVVCRWLVH